MSTGVRVRFAPSPTGFLHVGGARSALFNWLLAKKTGGTFILRIEDTDRSRHVEHSVERIADDLRWLGLQWDEGPQVDGDYGPYSQSERLDIYRKYCHELVERGLAYYALETPQDLQAMREQALREKRAYWYRRPDPLPTMDQVEAARANGQAVPVRFMTPAEDLVVKDEVLGDVSLAGSEIEDFIILKGDGWPTYHFACVVDDALMKIDFVLRGQEHLINTPKHLALQKALGFDTPRYAHLPIICNMDGTKMSKRTAIKDLSNKIGSVRKAFPNETTEQFVDRIASATGAPHATVEAVTAGKHDVIDDSIRAIAAHLGVHLLEVNVHDFRASGYLPEALLNFLSLLGWSPGEDREWMTLEETVALFDVGRVGKTSSRFDRDKLISFNTDWCNRIDADRLADAFDDYVRVSESPMQAADTDTRRHLLKICAGFRTFRELDEKCRALFLDDRAVVYDRKAVKKNLERGEGAGYKMLEQSVAELQQCELWTAEHLETFFEGLCRKHDVKLGHIAQPIRVAVSGGSVSPPIFDTLAILGKERTVNRIRRCLAQK